MTFEVDVGLERENDDVNVSWRRLPDPCSNICPRSNLRKACDNCPKGYAARISTALSIVGVQDVHILNRSDPIHARAAAQVHTPNSLYSLQYVSNNRS
jgi:hypothetical protein